MIRGECNCGTVAFEVTAVKTDIYKCHCSICRCATGGSGVPVIIASNDEFKWLRGEDNIATWKRADGDWQWWFCKTCGSPLPGENGGDNKFIPAGLIKQGDEELKIAHHIWVDSKASWDIIGDDGTQHPDGFGSGTE